QRGDTCGAAVQFPAHGAPSSSLPLAPVLPMGTPETDMPVLTDCRYALRSLARTPGFTVVAVLTLALGVGANTAIFSVVEAALLRPLPFPSADRLTLLWGTNPRSGRTEVPFSLPDLEDLRGQANTFESMGAMALGRFTVGGRTQPEMVQGAYATASFFSTLGLRP